MKKNKDIESQPQEIVKIPVSLDDFKFRKLTQDWGITFGLQSEFLQYGKPLMDFMHHEFILVLVRVEKKEDADKLMQDGEDDLSKLFRAIDG